MLKYCLLLTVLALGLLPATAAVTFRFNPPTGTAFTQTDTQTLTQTTTGQPTQTQTLEVKTKTVIDQTATGFNFTQTPLSKTTIVGSKRTTETDTDPVTSAPITLVLDAGGKAVAVQGFGKLQQRMLDKVNDESRKQGFDEKAIRAMFARLTARQKAEWGQTISLYAGKTVSLNDRWADATKPDEMGIVYKRITSFGPMKTINGKSCIRIAYAVTSDAASVRAALAKQERARAKAIAAQKGKAAASAPKFLYFTATEQGERYVDPATMLTYVEHVMSSRTQVVNVPGKGKITIAAIEIVEKRYDDLKALG
ncbi:MAG: hypothetical protein WCJ55_20390, partial [Chloroflexales bacterium]